MAEIKAKNYYPLELTMELRFVNRAHVENPTTGKIFIKILQQKFITKEDTAFGVLTTEVWRDVPLTEET